MTGTGGRIAVGDIGGTHARLAMAAIGRSTVAVGEPIIFDTGEITTFEREWRRFQEHAGETPDVLCLAIAGPVGGDAVKLTNNDWQFEKETLRKELGLQDLLVINDLAAVAWAVPELPAEAFAPICGESRTLPEEGVISVIGLGTGLGVAALVRQESAETVLATEGGHVDFAPHDESEADLVRRRRAQGERTSVEELVSGPGLRTIASWLAEEQELPATDEELWKAALGDQPPGPALRMLLANLGSFAGDVALMHGSSAVVLAGGLGERLAGKVAESDFRARFEDKSPYQSLMREIPVFAISARNAGLIGAAAYARRHARPSRC